jgi:hypothetical protein
VRSIVSKSFLTLAQQRALLATARGEVKRMPDANGSPRLACPKIASATLQRLLIAKLITDDPTQGAITTMISQERANGFCPAQNPRRLFMGREQGQQPPPPYQPNGANDARGPCPSLEVLGEAFR